VIVIVFLIAASIISHGDKGKEKSLPPLSSSLTAGATRQQTPGPLDVGLG
jgi:hypothetical protein